MTFRDSTVASWTVVALAPVCHIDSVAAQDEPFRFELAPYVGYRVGGEFEEEDGDGKLELKESSAQGIMLNIRANPNGQWEVLYARQDTEVDSRAILGNDLTLDLDVEYFHVGGTYLFDGDDTRPFVALTLGVSHFDPQPVELGSESYFSASIGGGVQLRATKILGVRLEGRVFTTLVESDTDIFCRSTGGTAACLIQVDGTALTQWELRVGLVFRF